MWCRAISPIEYEINEEYMFWKTDKDYNNEFNHNNNYNQDDENNCNDHCGVHS